MTNSFEKRVTTDIYEDGNRKFKLNSYDPIEGNYILTQVISFALPFGIGEAIMNAVSEESSELSNKSNNRNLPRMPKNEFISLVSDILRTIEEVYEGGATSPVVRENGTYGVDNLSMSLVVKLVIASLAFNFKGFFEDVPLLKEVAQL